MHESELARVRSWLGERKETHWRAFEAAWKAH